MADSKITQLTAITTVDTTDVLPIVDLTDVTTKKVTIAQIAEQAPVQSVASKTGAVTLVKGDVGLSNVDNTSDANKPVSTATQTALDAKQDTLVSGVNIKTINSTSILGSGNIVISGGGTPSGVAGAIQFSDGSAFASDATNFFWDDTNNRLGVGTNTPTARLQIKGSGSTSATTALLVQNSAGTQSLKLDDVGTLQIGLTSGINWIFNSNTLTSSQYAFISSNNGSILSTGALNGGVFGNNNGGKVADSGIANPQVASAVLEVSSTTRGFLPPRMTTTQKNAITSPAAGLVVYDSTTNKLQCYNGSTWNDLF